MRRRLANLPGALRVGLDLAIKLFAVLAAVAAADFFTLQAKVTASTPQLQEAVDTAKLQKSFGSVGLPRPVEAAVTALQNALLSPPNSQPSAGSAALSPSIVDRLANAELSPPPTVCAFTNPDDELRCLRGLRNQPRTLPTFFPMAKPVSFCDLYGDEVALLEKAPCDPNRLPPEFEQLLLMNNEEVVRSANPLGAATPASVPASPAPAPTASARVLAGDDLTNAFKNLRDAVYNVITVTVTNNGRGVATGVRVNSRLPNLRPLLGEEDTFALGSRDQNLLHFYDPGNPSVGLPDSRSIRVSNTMKDSPNSIRYRKVALFACVLIVVIVVIARAVFDKPAADGAPPPAG